MKQIGIKQSLVVFGSDAYAVTVAEAARAAGYVVVGYIDDNESPDTPCASIGLNRLGGVASLPEVLKTQRHACFHAASENSEQRKQWLDVLEGLLIPSIVHPSAVVSPSATVEDGTMIAPLSVVGARTSVGRSAVISSGAVIESECTLESFCRIGPRATILSGTTIGAGAVIEAGTIVSDDVAATMTIQDTQATELQDAPAV